MYKKNTIMIESRVRVKIDKRAKSCDTVEEAIKKGFIKIVEAECGSSTSENGIAGRVAIEKVKQLALESLIKWED